METLWKCPDERVFLKQSAECGTTTTGVLWNGNPENDIPISPLDFQVQTGLWKFSKLVLGFWQCGGQGPGGNETGLAQGMEKGDRTRIPRKIHGGSGGVLSVLLLGWQQPPYASDAKARIQMIDAEARNVDISGRLICHNGKDIWLLMYTLSNEEMNLDIFECCREEDNKLDYCFEASSKNF
ncbi:hypothetical protein WISP_46288 [Willisornis vidua]|uniref:Uncharacterized protein n=1 Tax=Willisornis vidua TaxID=1566151 RepID=A0ABQ9DFW8_9PASS|nr:hypothetical protein WISP_46288 [Willisornis vidua]